MFFVCFIANQHPVCNGMARPLFQNGGLHRGAKLSAHLYLLDYLSQPVKTSKMFYNHTGGEHLGSYPVAYYQRMCSGNS